MTVQAISYRKDHRSIVQRFIGADLDKIRNSLCDQISNVLC